ENAGLTAKSVRRSRLRARGSASTSAHHSSLVGSCGCHQDRRSTASRACTMAATSLATSGRVVSSRTKFGGMRIMTQSAASKALDTSVRKLSCILCENVRMASTRNDDRLAAQDPTSRRLLPLWPDLLVSGSRNVHVVDLRQRFQPRDFVEADHGMSG